MGFDSFGESHAERLEVRWGGADWWEAVAGGAVEEAGRSLLTPRQTVSVFALPVTELKDLNERQVRGMIEAGERDEERLVAALGTWPTRWPAGRRVRLSFLGINLSMRCDMQPRCVYCNQQPVAEQMTPADWRQVLAGLAAAEAEGEGPYVFFTGGEPLLFAEELWGPGGLLRTAHAAGAVCNVNTNALALTPTAALGLVSAGLGRVHISLDTHRPEAQDALRGGSGRWQQVMRGICNLQIAKALLGVQHPVIHVNCVLTRRNADDFPEFLRFLLSLRPRQAEGLSGDFDMHLIPVGGEQNRELRLTADEYVRFFTETGARAEEVWQEYQTEQEVPADQRGPLQEKVPFMSPFHRVEQRGDLREWAETAAQGRPAELALTPRCYVAPTQSFLLPDGSQYWCGGHATSRPEPLGQVRGAGVAENIQRSVGQVACLPGPHCHTCAGATQAINRSVENALRQTVREWLSPEGEGEAVGEVGEGGFE